MEFEYDPVKSASNLEKHGIDFDEAMELWNDRFMVEFELECKGEKRFAAIARYSGIVWFCVYTMRKNAVRIISVRRAVKGEVRLYDQQRNA